MIGRAKERKERERIGWLGGSGRGVRQDRGRQLKIEDSKIVVVIG